MDLRSWIGADVASLRQRLAGAFVDVVPADRWRERVDDGGIAPVYVVWHTARHHDLSVNRIVRCRGEMLEAWADRVGLSGDSWRGLAEGEDHELVDQLDPAAVGAYLLALLDDTATWLESADLPDLAAVPNAAEALASIGTPEDRFDWLYRMWAGKPLHFFLAWEGVAHGYNHLGELTSIRNRMGLSPF